MIYAISIGTNIGNRLLNIKTAIDEIKINLGEVINISAVYESEPWGFISKNWFYNAIIILKSNIYPQQLIEKLLEIEKTMGRERNEKGYVDRCIDLDVILCENFTICSKNITLPHPKMQERLFVLLPLYEVLPQWIHPRLKKNIYEMIQDCEDKGIIKRIKTE